MRRRTAARVAARRPARPRALAAIAAASVIPAVALAAPLEVVPRVGADFEHFGQTYRVTADADTVTLVDDYGTSAGLLLRTPGIGADRFEADAELYAGHSTRRARVRVEGRAKRGATVWDVRQEAVYLAFTDGGDYTVSGDRFEERLTAAWERRMTGPWSVRLGGRFDGTWYETQDPYNLTAWTTEPRADLALDFGAFSRAGAGYRFARRDVPDSASLGFDRHTGVLSLSWAPGADTVLDILGTLERRRYDEGSARESSREGRTDLRFEFGLTDAVTCRVQHENEIVRYDEPDELDFDSDWGRTGLQLTVHRTAALDLSIMPLHAFLSGATSPEEEYHELGVELGVDWRFGRRGWVSVTNEIGRRDYRVDAPAEEPDLAADVLPDDASATASSDYTYDRLTLLLGAEPWPGVAANLFVHWQPEDHAVSRHDNETRIVSGGLTYSF